jgi:CRISPR-associated protein Cas1
MDSLLSSDLKAILHSKRANLYYLEYCRVMQKDGRVLYLTEAKKENLYFNIPITNTTVLLLGNGPLKFFVDDSVFRLVVSRLK